MSVTLVALCERSLRRNVVSALELRCARRCPLHYRPEPQRGSRATSAAGERAGGLLAGLSQTVLGNVRCLPGTHHGTTSRSRGPLRADMRSAIALPDRCGTACADTHAVSDHHETVTGEQSLWSG